MGDLGFLVCRGGATIGKVKRNAEPAGSDGRGGSVGGIRGNQPGRGSYVVVYVSSWSGPRAAADRGGVGSESGAYGSSALGLSEVNLLGFQPPDAQHCSFSPSVYAGWLDRKLRAVRRG